MGMWILGALLCAGGFAGLVPWHTVAAFAVGGGVVLFDLRGLLAPHWRE